MNVAVVGAGPAGASCACLLAGAGMKPLLIDGSHPRDAPCGGLISEHDVESWGELRAFGGWRRFDGDRLYTTRAGATIRLSGDLAADRYMIASRRDLDLHLLERAGALGARVVRHDAVGITRLGKGWRIAARDGREFAVDLVVGADGVRSVVRRATAGPFEWRELTVAAGRRLPGVDVAVIHTAALGGNCAGTLLPGVGMAQAVVGGPRGAPLRPLLDEFVLRMLGPDAPVGERFGGLHPAPPGPDFFDPPRAGRGWILIGDAAGFCNRTTGEGLRYAFASAHAAAGAIIAGRPENYEERWRDTIGGELRTGSRRSHFKAPGAFEEAAALVLARAPRLAAAAHSVLRRRYRPGVAS